jgi:hypothetical protein
LFFNLLFPSGLLETSDTLLEDTFGFFLLFSFGLLLDPEPEDSAELSLFSELLELSLLVEDFSFIFLRCKRRVIHNCVQI